MISKHLFLIINIIYSFQYVTGRILKKNHFWGSYKFPLDLKLDLVYISMSMIYEIKKHLDFRKFSRVTQNLSYIKIYLYLLFITAFFAEVLWWISGSTPASTNKAAPEPSSGSTPSTASRYIRGFTPGMGMGVPFDFFNGAICRFFTTCVGILQINKTKNRQISSLFQCFFLLSGSFHFSFLGHSDHKQKNQLQYLFFYEKSATHQRIFLFYCNFHQKKRKMRWTGQKLASKQTVLIFKVWFLKASAKSILKRVFPIWKSFRLAFAF